MRSLFGRLHRRYGKKITGDERQIFVTKQVDQRQLLTAAREAKEVSPRGVARPRVAILPLPPPTKLTPIQGQPAANRAWKQMKSPTFRTGGVVLWSQLA